MGYGCDPMNTPLAPLWLSDTAWLEMDPVARGFHTQLMLVAARRKPAGTLPDDDAQWRKLLGLPARVAVRPGRAAAAFEGINLMGALQQREETGEGVPELAPDALTLWLWETRWKPMVLRGWELIDEALIAQHPHLQGVMGGWFSSLALAMSQPGASGVGAGAAAKPAKPKAKPRKTPGLGGAWKDQLDNEGEAAGTALACLGVELTSLSNPVLVLSKWRADTDEHTRKTMWEIGIGCLAGANGSESEKRQARSIIGKHIKTYGEEPVARAIGALAMRPIAPADAVAFLLGLLKQDTEGSVSQQSARQKRASVCL